MPKPKRNQSPTLSLDEYLKQYDTVTVKAMMQDLNNSIAWNIFAGFLRAKQREFEVAALDFAGKDGHEMRAAHASGVALGIGDAADYAINEFVRRLSGHTGVVEDVRPE